MTSSEKYTSVVNAKLKEAIHRFRQTGPRIDDETIAGFLKDTEGSGLSENNRLTALLVGGNLTWQQTCQLCEVIIAVSEPGEQAGTYINWLAAALNYWLLDKSGLSFDERCAVAADVQHILDRSLKLLPEHSGFALMYASFYQQHPRRSMDNEKYLREAINWFKAGSLWAEKSRNLEDAAESNIGAGNSFFELEDWDSALSEYDKVDLQWLKDSGFDSLSNLRNNIDVCRKMISMRSS
jgi:tetratricopeptide (TPR) repeat protein